MSSWRGVMDANRCVVLAGDSTRLRSPDELQSSGVLRPQPAAGRRGAHLRVKVRPLTIHVPLTLPLLDRPATAELLHKHR